LEDREKLFEDKSVRDHDEKLALEYAKKLSEAQAIGSKETELSLANARSDLESQLMDVRKEVLDEVREAKDEIAQLKLRVKRLESRS